MAEYKNVFEEEIEVPEIVMQKAEQAFLKIKQEGTIDMEDRKEMKKVRNRKKKSFFRKQATVAACACLFVAVSISAVAAIRHIWSRGMKGALQATEIQQQTLTEQGIATVLPETENYEEMAVTNGGVTIVPDTVIVDEGFAYLSFIVKGYTIGENMEPCFEFVNTYLGDDSNAEDGSVNLLGGSFYDGIVSDENGELMYDDGTSLQYGQEGNFISHYTDEEGNLEYNITIMGADYNQSLLGKTIHVNFSNMGTVYQAKYTGDLEGEWDFTLKLADVSAADYIHVAKQVEGTPFSIENISLSPVSIKINYTVNGETSIHEDENGVPNFQGVVLKDGTKLSFIANGGMTGYTDETRTSAYSLTAFDRVIETKDVKAILLQEKAGADIIQVEIAN